VRQDLVSAGELREDHKSCHVPALTLESDMFGSQFHGKVSSQAGDLQGLQFAPIAPRFSRADTNVCP